jgi:hypothetical protein
MLECDIDPDDVIACKTNAECSKILDTCQITSCYGRTIQTCGGLCPK